MCDVAMGFVVLVDLKTAQCESQAACRRRELWRPTWKQVF
jgi:hypothetical protein